ncbi:MAG: cell wall-binding repeat-containing protein [Acidimicrobiia bacterium]
MKFRRTFFSAVAAGAVCVATAGTAFATTDVEATRLAGVDRYGTSEAIALDTFTSATVAVIASGESYPDALAASYLAGALDGPIVLTASAGLSQDARDTLQALDVRGAIVVGGTDAISETVVNQLVAAGLEVDRLGGNDRYATARIIAESVPAEQIGSYEAGIGRTALLASGQGFADALSGGPLAYASAFPMLLTPTASLSAQAAAAIDTLGIEQVLVLGGTAAISQATEDQLVALGVEVLRLAGNDRTATAAVIAETAIAELAFTPTHVNLARGDDFADALAGSANAGEEVAPIVLTLTPNQLGTATAQFLGSISDTLATIHVYGGPNAVSDSTVNAAEVAAGRAP